MFLYISSDRNVLQEMGCRKLSILCSSGRNEETLECVEAYLKATKMFRDYSDPNNDPVFSEVRLEHTVGITLATMYFTVAWL